MRMAREYKFCPFCAGALSKNADGRPQCSCGFIHYDNPVPVVAMVVPFMQQYIGTAPTDVAFAAPNNCPDPRLTGILLVQRGVPPFKGDWCLPCGYLNRHEHPKAAAVREVKEETGIETRIEKILCVCNPMPGEINQSVISYLGRPVLGALHAGDDAAAVGIFGYGALPNVCFRSHRMLIDEWYNGTFGRLSGKDLRV